MTKNSGWISFVLNLAAVAVVVHAAAQDTAGGFSFERVRREPALVGTVQTCNARDPGPDAPINDVVRRALAATGNPHAEFAFFVPVRCMAAHGPSYIDVFFATRSAAHDFAAGIQAPTPTPIRVRIIGAITSSPIAFVVLAD